MDVNERNRKLAAGEINRDDLWPKVEEWRNQPLNFKFNFGLDQLPEEPGMIFVRGPRQYGKSTWLELALLDTVEDFGKGSGYFLNGDELIDANDLEKNILEVSTAFSKKAKVKRLFIDEITSIIGWEKVLKKIVDRGELKDVLFVTTGSNAADLRRGVERLPGRKGKLNRTDYIFTGISYKDFYSQCSKTFEDKTWIAYLLTGGSPIAAKEIWQFEHIPDYFYEINRDWVLGELAKSGRSRSYVLSVLKTILNKGISRIGYLGLAKESGLANNTLAAEYVEQLSDLLCITASHQWDADKEVTLQRKPCKFHPINLSMALSFYPNRLNSVHEFEQISDQEKAKWLEWLVAQELFRRQCILGQKIPDNLHYWSSKEHEIDFVSSRGDLFEVKLGQSNPLEFAWFSKVFPKKKLLVINKKEFETSHVKGITIEQFLLSDGFPHPYPGEVDDPNIYNDYSRFN
ncbi:MAG: ATP-binding protein [Xanthomonadaceae bacterium]|nr:ATP-binding protein [Xanthomonadaceae bacterium]